jgi:hypothetical protein
MRIILFLFLALSLFGRDNPFFPTDPNKEQIQSTNRVQKLQPFTTQKILLPNSARAVKGITIRYQNLDGSISNEELILNSEIDWHEPFVITHKLKRESAVKAKSITKTIKTKHVRFEITKNNMVVKTSDKLLENFLLTHPHRVVMDFKRNTSFRPITYKINKAPFSKIRMGNHDGYYRVVIELDGQYRYKLETREKEYTIVVN